MKDIKLKNTCYVLVQTNSIHPMAYEKHNLIWYPERSMTLLDCVQYVPYIKSVVTENPWIIACYDSEDVRIWDDEYGWISPNDQTYGASINYITMKLLGIKQTIPSITLDGGEAIRKLIKRLENYDYNKDNKANKAKKQAR